MSNDRKPHVFNESTSKIPGLGTSKVTKDKFSESNGNKQSSKSKPKRP